MWTWDRVESVRLRAGGLWLVSCFPQGYRLTTLRSLYMYIAAAQRVVDGGDRSPPVEMMVTDSNGESSNIHVVMNWSRAYQYEQTFSLLYDAFT